MSRPTYTGGLGFGLKWDMGWMHDALAYFASDPIGRRYHHHQLTFRSMYFWSENYVLPLSHDEVVHGKRSLLQKMHGDLWQRFANLRLLYASMWAQPGKKLLFQGGEFGQYNEWAHDRSVDWHLLGDSELHVQLMALIMELNRLYKSERALHVHDVGLAGFEWVDANDDDNSVYTFLRKGDAAEEVVLVVFNSTPVPRHDYRVGVPIGGVWREILNTDAAAFGGSGMGNLGTVTADAIPFHARPASLRLTLPPLAALYLAPARERVRPWGRVVVGKTAVSGGSRGGIGDVELSALLKRQARERAKGTARREAHVLLAKRNGMAGLESEADSVGGRLGDAGRRGDLKAALTGGETHGGGRAGRRLGDVSAGGREAERTVSATALAVTEG